MTGRALLVAVLLATMPSAVRADEEPPTLPPGVHALRPPYGVECDPSQFAPLERTVGDARVVALGEASHGSRTIFEAKACTVRFLAEEMGFRVLAFEGNVDGYAHQANLEQAFATSRSIYAVESVLDLVQWVHAKNETGANIVLDGFDVTLAGLDLDGTAEQDDLDAIDGILDLLATEDPAYAERVRPTLEELRTASPERWEENAEVWLHQTRDLLAHLETNREALAARVPARDVERTIHDARRIVQVLDRFVAGNRRRDESMAENVLWALDRHPGERFILWAHNNHVRESRLFQPAAPAPMGEHLSDALGEDYVSIAYTFGTGAYTATSTVASCENPAPDLGTHEADPPMEGTLEAALRDLRWPDLLVLLDALDASTREELGLNEPPQAMRSIGYKASRNAYAFYDLPQAFDALVYLARSLPSNPVAAP